MFSVYYWFLTIMTQPNLTSGKILKWLLYSETYTIASTTASATASTSTTTAHGAKVAGNAHSFAEHSTGSTTKASRKQTSYACCKATYSWKDVFQQCYVSNFTMRSCVNIEYISDLVLSRLPSSSVQFLELAVRPCVPVRVSVSGSFGFGFPKVSTVEIPENPKYRESRKAKNF